MRAAARTLLRAWTEVLSPDGVSCSGQPQGHSDPGAVLEDLRSPAFPRGAPHPVRRAAGSRTPTPGFLQPAVSNRGYDDLDDDVDADVPGVAWLLLATEPWNILLNTAGMLAATGLEDIGALKEAICVRPRSDGVLEF